MAEETTGKATISIGIPAYNRPKDLDEAIRSIAEQEDAPAELVICEDGSPLRTEIREMVETWRDALSKRNCTLNYIENPQTLGYDANVRNVIRSATSDWVLLLGDDDVLLPNCVNTVESYLKFNKPRMVSRTVIRFSTSIAKPIGISRLASEDRVFRPANSKAGMAYRACGFVGGLIIDKRWADEITTDRYDGGLYYQWYLAASAYCTTGIGYISTPIVGGRTGNPPLFGAAAKEKGLHVAGSYSPGARAAMWSSVLEISGDVETIYGCKLYRSVRRELTVHGSFNVFESMTSQPVENLRSLRVELERIGLFSHPFPKTLYWINRILGRKARYVYAAARSLLQT